MTIMTDAQAAAQTAWVAADRHSEHNAWDVLYDLMYPRPAKGSQ